MKFKGTLKISSIPVILGLLHGLSRYSKSIKSEENCISRMKITKSKIYFNVRDSRLIETYSEINTEDFLNEGYIIESKRKNEIALDVDMSSLYETFKCFSCISSHVIIKLSRRDQIGVLSFEFQDSHLQNVWITKDCPVTPLSGTDFEESATPEIPSCEWNFELPPIKKMLNVFEKIKKSDGDLIFLEVSADLDSSSSVCDLSISSISELLKIKSCFKGCQLFTGTSNPYPSKSCISKLFQSKLLITAFKIASDCTLGRKNESFVIASIPESQNNIWMCIMQSFHSIESCRLFYIVRAQLNSLS